MKKNIEKIHLPENQYDDASKLRARQAIYQYSLKKDTVWQWASNKYPIFSDAKILEVGCGNGVFWKDALKIFPQNLHVTLTDYSIGMLNEAKKNLENDYHFKYAVADVENLCYSENSFDTVFSHYMLYHTNSPHIALQEINRVLKKTGFCGILLPDNHHMESVFNAIEVDYPKHAQPFSYETAVESLPRIFSSVTHYEYKDIIRVNNVDIILSYIASLSNLDQYSDAFYKTAKEKLMRLMKPSGFIELFFNQHLFVVKP